VDQPDDGVQIVRWRIVVPVCVASAVVLAFTATSVVRWSAAMNEADARRRTGDAAESRELDAVGGRLFIDTCATCHDRSGMGLEGRAPALAGSRYAREAPDRLVRIILDGFETPEAQRHGVEYLLPMPAWRTLDDRQLAALTSFVRRRFGAGAAPVSPALVASIRARTDGRYRAWTAEELAGEWR
jgi:mono/diheme cytochrome c family protein